MILFSLLAIAAIFLLVFTVLAVSIGTFTFAIFVVDLIVFIGLIRFLYRRL